MQSNIANLSLARESAQKQNELNLFFFLIDFLFFCVWMNSTYRLDLTTFFGRVVGCFFVCFLFVASKIEITMRLAWRLSAAGGLMGWRWWLATTVIMICCVIIVAHRLFGNFLQVDTCMYCRSGSIILRLLGRPVKSNDKRPFYGGIRRKWKF